MQVKTIGVLTSGGDAPGMNAAIRAAVRTAAGKGMQIIGIHRGYMGLIEKDVEPMTIRSVSDIIHRGGTSLYTARCPEFKTEEGLQKAVASCKELGIDGIVCIGGDGTFRGARDLSERGIPCVGVPATIDNDIACTDYTIGFDTAMNTCMEMVDRLRDTSQSHERCSVVEIMGRGAGYLALHSGIAVGATSIIVAEEDINIQRDIIDRVRMMKMSGKQHFIIVVSEAVGNVERLAVQIEAVTGIETRATILGHVQRGGSPTVRDRVAASNMGYHAVELLAQGIGNRVVAEQRGQIIDFDIFDALQMIKPFSHDLYEIAHKISI